MSWEKAITFTLRWEGGYTNHPADKGVDEHQERELRPVLAQSQAYACCRHNWTG